MTGTRERIAAEVRAELARQRKPQTFVAEILNLDRGSVSLRLAGTRDFRAEEIVAIAEALGVPAAQFMDVPQVVTVGTGPRAPYPPSDPRQPRPPAPPAPPPKPPAPRPSKGGVESDGEAA